MQQHSVRHRSDVYGCVSKRLGRLDPADPAGDTGVEGEDGDAQEDLCVRRPGTRFNVWVFP